ncbi:MAG TPA: hypothetical protein VMU89_20575 [Thermomicrobiaceae bacterium]|nr:hypothetical protein [Thermomicrobiaceae bacterium]
MIANHRHVWRMTESGDDRRPAGFVCVECKVWCRADENGWVVRDLLEHRSVSGTTRFQVLESLNAWLTGVSYAGAEPAFG